MGARVLVEWTAAGAVLGQLAATAPPGAWTAWTVALAAVVLGAALSLASVRRPQIQPVASAALGACIAAALVARASAVPDEPRHVARLPLPVRGRLVATVAFPPEARSGRVLVTLEAERVEWKGGHAHVVGRVGLTVRGGAALALRRGDRIAIDTTLRAPRSFGNPGAFDFAGSLARRGVHVTASVWDRDRIVRLGEGEVPAWAAAVDRWRDTVGLAIDAAASGDPAAVLRALVLGDDGAVSHDVRRAFTRLGVVHVLSVSGLHVSIVAALIAVPLGLALGHAGVLLRRMDVRACAVAVGVVGALGYGLLAGAAVATVRAVAMAGAAALALCLQRRAEPFRCLALAALGLAVLEPGAAAEIGYQLSFVSVGALIVGARGGTGSPGGDRRLVRSARAATAAWLGTAPLTAFHFHQVSLASVPANLALVPLFGAVVLAPALIGAVLAPTAPGVASVCFAAAALPVGLAVTLVRLVADVEGIARDVPIPTLGELALVYGAMAGWLLRPRPGAHRLLAACAFLLAADAIGWAWVRLRPSGFRATFLDVGQGDAAVLELPGGRVVVVDAGGFPGSDFDPGDAIVEPFLRTRKIQSIDALVMSHAHPDHAGGLAHLVRAFGPEEVWLPPAGREGAAWDGLAAALRATGVPARVLAAGRSIPRFPDVEVLHPPEGWSRPSLNDGSLVLAVRVGPTTLCLAGDAEAAAEAAMLARGLASTDVLKVPHHGSRTSSTWPFVARAAPAVAVVSIGHENRYGHPAPEVTARYERVGAVVLRTDRCGAVSVEGDHDVVTAWGHRPACARTAIRTPRRP